MNLFTSSNLLENIIFVYVLVISNTYLLSRFKIDDKKQKIRITNLQDSLIPSIFIKSTKDMSFKEFRFWLFLGTWITLLSIVNFLEIIFGFYSLLDLYTGIIFGIYAPTIVNSLKIYLTRKYSNIDKHITGEIVYSEFFGYHSTLVNYLAYFFIFSVFLLHTQSFFIAGATLGPVVMAVKIFRLRQSSKIKNNT